MDQKLKVSVRAKSDLYPSSVHIALLPRLDNGGFLSVCDGVISHLSRGGMIIDDVRGVESLTCSFSLFNSAILSSDLDVRGGVGTVARVRDRLGCRIRALAANVRDGRSIGS